MVKQQEVHPYMKEYMEAPLMMHRFKLECLIKRSTLLEEGFSQKSEYEKNEIQIKKIETQGEIKVLSRMIAEREAYYIMYFNKQFLPSVADMEDNYGSVIEKARRLAKENEEIKELLGKVEFQAQGSANIEGKLLHFKMLQNLIK